MASTTPRRWTKRILWTLAMAAAALLVARAYRAQPVLVDLGLVERGPLVVTLDDDGRTRVRERYVVSAPLDGTLARIVLDPGDPVCAGETVLAELVPGPSPLLDPRQRSEAEARVELAAAELERARALVARAEAEADFARAERERREQAGGAEARIELDRARSAELRARAELGAARFGAQVAEHQLQLARVVLEEDPGAETGGRVVVRSPVDGQVLRVLRESAGPVTQGAGLVELASTDSLEVVADYLSQDAVRMRPGMEVRVEGWGGEEVLQGRVRRVEPAGYTKVSALGVEEQRVDVVVDPVEPLEPWRGLGDGYRVDLRVVLWRGEDVMQVPTGALFRDGDAWAVFVAEEGRARRARVELGRENGLHAEVLGGLREGQQVVLYPSELVSEGARLESR